MLNLKFSGRGASFLCHFMAKNDIRYQLCGLFFKPGPRGGVMGAAANGHIMGLWYDNDGHVDRPCIARIDKPLQSALKKFGATLEERDNRLACIGINGQEAYIQPEPLMFSDREDGVQAWEIQAKYMDIARHVSKLKDVPATGMTGAVNAHYLGVLRDATKMERLMPAVYLRQHDEYDMVSCVFPTIPQAAAIIIPMRADKLAVPPWLADFKEAEK